MATLDVITVGEDMERLDLGKASSERREIPELSIWVDTEAAVGALVDTLSPLEGSNSAIYVDLEGVNLSRHGSISLIQIWIPAREQAFIVDVHTLGAQAFSTPGANERTLKHILESEAIEKHFFDVRNDSDALFALFNIKLAGVVDVQLLELASRRGSKHTVSGLAACIEQEQTLPRSALLEFQSRKKEVVKMFDPKLGGSYEVFNQRPLPPILMDYCVSDVSFLPVLSRLYRQRLSVVWLEQAQVETRKRLEESRSAGYEPKGKKKIFGPRCWRFPLKQKREGVATVNANAQDPAPNAKAKGKAHGPESSKKPQGTEKPPASNSKVPRVTRSPASGDPALPKPKVKATHVRAPKQSAKAKGTTNPANTLAKNTPAGKPPASGPKAKEKASAPRPSPSASEAKSHSSPASGEAPGSSSPISPTPNTAV